MIDPNDIKMEPGVIKQEPDPDSTTGNSPKKKAGRPKKMKQEKITEHVTVVKKPRKKVDRFKGMPEEEVVMRLLPDHLAPNLDIVIVGINPGLYAAFVGHHYAGPGNHFWKCLYLSGLIPEPMNAMQDRKLLDYGIGFTNIVARTTRGSADLKKKEIQEGAKILTEKLLEYKPKIAVFNGKGIYEVFVGHKNFYFGKQPELLPGTETAVYVMPSSSARCSQLPRAVDKVPFYAALRKFRDHLVGKLPDLSDSEITFPDLELKTVKKEVKQEIKQEGDQCPMDLPQNPPLPVSGGFDNLCQFTPGSYQVLPHSVPNTTQGFHGMFGSSSQVSLPQIKQEPGTSSNPAPPPLQQFDVKIKQEPGVSSTEASCPAISQSNPFSHGQYEMYSQSQMSSQSGDSHLNNFLHGLYGMVNQVACQDPSSKYGVVHQASTSSSKPIQFNDALCDIVKEGNAFELDLEPRNSPNPEKDVPTKKKSKPRKRKSKSENPSSSPEMTSSDSGGHFPSPYQPQMPTSTTDSQFNSTPIYQPLQPYGSHAYPQMQIPDFSHPTTTYSGMPHFPQPPPATSAYSQNYPMGHQGYYQPQSFSQMMHDGPYFNGLPSNGHSSANQSFMSQNGHVNQSIPNSQSDVTSPKISGPYPGSFDGHLNIKQEKPDE